MRVCVSVDGLRGRVCVCVCVCVCVLGCESECVFVLAHLQLGVGWAPLRIRQNIILQKCQGMRSAVQRP